MLRQAVILLTYACNLRCGFCEYAGKDRSLSLTREQLEAVADGYRPAKANLMGGEPLLSPLLADALEIFSPATVQTNGLLVPERMGLLERARQVIVSLEGDRAWHDRLRGRGTYGRALRAVRMLKERSIPVLLRASVHPKAMGQVRFLTKLASELEVGLYFYPLLGERFTGEQAVWLFEWTSRHENVWVDLPQYFCWLGAGGLCAAGESRLAFSPDGVFPCQWMTDCRLGGIEDDPGLVLEGARAFRSVKTAPRGCLPCRFAWSCRGGCLVLGGFPCPMRNSRGPVHRVREDGEKLLAKATGIKRLLRGVVTC